MSESDGDAARFFEFSTGDITAAEFQQQLDAIKPTAASGMLPVVEQLLEILPKGEDWHEVHRNQELHAALVATLERFNAMESEHFGDAMMEPTPDDQKASEALSLMQDILQKPLFRSISRDGEVRYNRDPVAEIRKSMAESGQMFENPLPDNSERSHFQWSGGRVSRTPDRTLKLFHDGKGSSGPEVA